MLRIYQVALFLAASIILSPGLAQPLPEPTDVRIRRMAGLPAATVNGHIRIIDIGHGPGDTMLSIVANRTKAGWVVSYACAASPRCAASADHAARRYTLSTASSAEVDQIIKSLKSGTEPDGQQPSPTFIGGQLTVLIDYRGFKREYRRAGQWGQVLGRLEALMARSAK